jgi:hypothetical protein
MSLGEKARECLRAAKGMGFLPGFLEGLLLARWSEEGA